MYAKPSWNTMHIIFTWVSAAVVTCPFIWGAFSCEFVVVEVSFEACEEGVVVSVGLVTVTFSNPGIDESLNRKRIK